MLKDLLELVNDNTPSSEPVKDKCAVCARKLGSGASLLKNMFSMSQFNMKLAIQSDYVCNHCSVFFSRQNWVDYCKRNDKDYHFPAVKDKNPAIANWMFFSHYFAENDHRIVRVRQDWRSYLTNPPEGRFCFVLSTMCKKHIIHKSTIQRNRDCFFILFEDKHVLIEREKFAVCLMNFEKLYAVGLSKSSIRTGEYNTSSLMKVDHKLLFSCEDILSAFRQKQPDYMSICEFIGGK